MPRIGGKEGLAIAGDRGWINRAAQLWVGPCEDDELTLALLQCERTRPAAVARVLVGEQVGDRDPPRGHLTAPVEGEREPQVRIGREVRLSDEFIPLSTIPEVLLVLGPNVTATQLHAVPDPTIRVPIFGHRIRPTRIEGHKPLAVNSS